MAYARNKSEEDIFNLIERNHSVTVVRRGKEYYIKFYGPMESPYEGGVWKISLEIPEEYPKKAPTVEFLYKIFHPNVDAISGIVCPTQIEAGWNNCSDLRYIFEVFLPDLLNRPNFENPINLQAANLFDKNPAEYVQHIKREVKKYASEEQWTSSHSVASEKAAVLFTMRL